MLKRLLRFLPAFLLVLLPLAVAAQTYTSSEGRFRVNFPGGDPKTASEVMNLKGGGTSTLFEFSNELDGGNVAYMVMYYDYPSDYASGDAQSVLRNTRDGAVSGKTLLTDQEVTLNGIPGRAFTAKDDQWTYSVRQYLKGKRLYQLIVVSNVQHPATKTDEFFTSFSTW